MLAAPVAHHQAVEPKLLANAIRFLSIDAIERANEGHQGVPLGMAEIATALFTRHMKFDPANPQWPDRDRFVLSNGHGSMLLYSVLHLTGYERMSLDEIRNFRVFGSHCAGHPEFDTAAGIEVTTGPLGQGIANALGMAIAEERLRAQFGAELVDHYTYAFVGDGCLQEGIGQEVISLAGHLKLGRLMFFWDDNRITDDGSTDLSISEDVAERFRVAGWHVQEVDGHDVEAVSQAIDAAKNSALPSLIACRTVIARGIPRLEGTRGGHSARLFQEDLKAAREQLGWPHAPFEIPSEILSEWRAAGARGASHHADWVRRLGGEPDARRQSFMRMQAGELAEGWRDAISAYKQRAVGEALTQPPIQSSGEIASLLYATLPEIMVGCADLEAPTNHKRELDAFNASNRGGSYVHCGVREHVMGALANGQAAHGGINPIAVTYLAFSDYERPAMRMAALMGLPVKFVFSHDSIGIGRNGPTHQPVEILAALRAMPNLLVLRPADAVEVAECWEIAMEQTATPSALIFARQATPPVRHAMETENLCRRGAYVLEEAEGGPRRATLLATGSEVSIAIAARALLQEQGIPTAVVSMPCWELFDQQPEAYRAEILGYGTVRVAIEAAVRLGWDQYIGDKGAFVGMSSFGASGPAETLFEHFGITAKAVVDHVLRRL